MLLLTTQWLDGQRIDWKMAACLREIGEYKGCAQMYGVHISDAMESLRQVTAEHSATAAGRLERSETSIEQSNYRRLILELQDAAQSLPVEAPSIVTVHEGLFRESGREAGIFRSADTGLALAKLCENYRRQEKSTDPILLIGAFVAGFLSILPFAAGNLRLALLIAGWLLNRSGYSINRYVSFERVMATKQEIVGPVLGNMMGKTDLAEADLAKWRECWLEILLLAYRNLSARAAALSGRRGAKTELVLAWIDAAPDDFSIREIQQQVPECGIELIRKIIKEQKSAGMLQCLGRGPNARWRKRKRRKLGTKTRTKVRDGLKSGKTVV